MCCHVTAVSCCINKKMAVFAFIHSGKCNNIVLALKCVLITFLVRNVHFCIIFFQWKYMIFSLSVLSIVTMDTQPSITAVHGIQISRFMYTDMNFPFFFVTLSTTFKLMYFNWRCVSCLHNVFFSRSVSTENVEENEGTQATFYI